MLNSFTTNEMRRKCEENQIHRNLGINGKYAKSIDAVLKRAYAVHGVKKIVSNLQIEKNVS